MGLLGKMKTAMGGDDPQQAPYQVQVGNPVPPEGIPLIFPGSKLPAMYLPGDIPENVVINWKTALASFTNG